MPKAKQVEAAPSQRIGLVYILALVLILLMAAYLRFTGIDWAEGQNLHPDELFLSNVEGSIQPVGSLGEYFDTANSSLNPANRGHSFFVYGTLPLFMVRYAADAVDMAGRYTVVGRYLSAWMDLGLVLLVYLIAARLFDRRVGLLAALVSAFTVMQIQQSHFFTVDNFTNFFAFLAIYFAVRIATEERRPPPAEGGEDASPGPRMPFALADVLLFGLALGLAVASKVSIAPLAVLLPLAVMINLLRIPEAERELYYGRGFLWMVTAALISFVVFRIFQPYAFEGPGFFNISLNPQWLDTMRTLQGQISGDVDWPPSMQWARRSFFFGFENMVKWGLGLPLALLVWLGFLWAGWRLVRGAWHQPFALVWLWGAGYFLWQSLAFNPTMRYFLPVYPVLALFGAWAVFQLWDAGSIKLDDGTRWRFWARPLGLLLAVTAVLGAAWWSLAFVRIYNEPSTRVAASRWIHANAPGPLNLDIVNQEGEQRQLMSYPYGQVITPEQPYFTSVVPRTGGRLERLYLHHLVAPTIVRVSPAADETATPITSSQVVDIESLAPGDQREISFSLSPASFADPALDYQLSFVLPAGSGSLLLERVELRSSAAPQDPGLPLLAEPQSLALGDPFIATFSLDTGTLPDRLVVAFRVENELQLAPLDLHLTISSSPEMDQVLTEADLTARPRTRTGGFTEGASFELGRLIRVEANEPLYLQISLESPGALTLLGSAVANETSWDLGLPLRIDGYDSFGGIYQGDLNFEMYWTADAAKLERFLNILERAEYIFISSSRQWASLPRIPERFPLVTEYYRHLLGCPPSDSIEWCFNVAEVGRFEGDLGFELVQVFETRPAFGPLEINDQPAEEAFTVYDHSKVFIFRKSADYDHQHVVDLLSAVDLSQVQNITPKQASGRAQPTLMLPTEALETQRAGGTWSDLFDRDSWINASPWVSALVWYLVLGLLGLAVYPILRMALPGLLDGGYAFSRLAALLLLSWMGWFAGSIGLPSTRLWLAVFALLLVVLGWLAARPQWEVMRAEWEAKRRRFMRIELLFLLFFVLMLLIRFGNPDLWHPGKGGEKPMDFAYFNAVMKSSSFPPYDPWFSAGYINYYYYGFVLVGSLTELLGIVPSVAYNLILPTLFAMLAVGAYCIVWNLWKAWLVNRKAKSPVSAHFAGVSAAVAAVLLGNLGSLQMIIQGYQRLGAAGAPIEGASLLTRLLWTLSGFVQTVGGQPLPWPLADWYWNPTRLHPDVPIAEFPLFTFTYADLHAHMIAMPVTLLALAWGVSAILSRAWEGRRSWPHLSVSFLLGGLAIGALRATNTWDFPTYLALGVIAVAVAIWLYWPRREGPDGSDQVPLLAVLGGVAALTAISLLAYQPYAEWYSQGYTSLFLWEGGRTLSRVYLLHWGLFLFVLGAWMAWETRQWLAQTPLSSLRKLDPYRGLILLGVLALFGTVLGLQMYGVNVAWLVIPLMAWAALLIARPGQDPVKRMALFMIGTGLFLTLMVEVIVLAGDIGRMNTLFKFYLQVWLLFSVAGALALAWTLDELAHWGQFGRRAWQLTGTILIASAALFLLLGVSAKVRDRMALEAPQTLDGNAYLEYAIYHDQGQELHLSEDYAALQWLQENVEGSPVIVEAHIPEYRWGARMSINTGLPAVLGWNWHQRQQREFVPGNDIWGRADDVTNFYQGGERAAAVAFLREYQVRYIIVGELERAYYSQLGLLKFETWDGVLWEEVFRIDNTVIYRVLDETLAGN